MEQCSRFPIKMCAKQKVKNQHIYFIFNVMLSTHLDKHSNTKAPKSHSHSISFHTQALAGPWLLHISIFPL